jgi:alpha-methylacyl-CoA racemase
MLLAFGIVCALLEAQRSGRGQVVDAAMTDGAALLMAMQYSFKAMGHWNNRRQANLLDGGAAFYGTYECADGKWLAVGPIESQFLDFLLGKIGLPQAEFSDRWDPQSWPRLRERLSERFRARTRAQWCELLEGTDACVAPVLDMDEAPQHPHNRARGTFVIEDGAAQPAPAPRFSRTVPGIQRPPPKPGEHSIEILRDWGIGAELIDSLKRIGAI